MLDTFSLLMGFAFGSTLCAAGWLVLRRLHLGQIGRLAALQKRQIGASAERLADALRRSDILKEEVLPLKKEIVHLQNRRARQDVGVVVAEAPAVRRSPALPTRREQRDDGSGFANTQPRVRDSH